MYSFYHTYICVNYLQKDGARKAVGCFFAFDVTLLSLVSSKLKPPNMVGENPRLHYPTEQEREPQKEREREKEKLKPSSICQHPVESTNELNQNCIGHQP